MCDVGKYWLVLGQRALPVRMRVYGYLCVCTLHYQKKVSQYFSEAGISMDGTP